MNYRFFAIAVCISFSCSPAFAQQRSYSGVTAEDVAEEQEACGADARRFCGGNDIALFEMESCLSRYVPRLSAACRDEIAPTDFKKYYQQEAHPFNFD